MTKKQLRDLHCHNAHNFTRHGEAYIEYRAADYGRDGHGRGGWVVKRNGYRTSVKSASLLDYGNKVFGVSHDKEAALRDAKKWAGEKYGIKIWTKTPFGTWMEEKTVATRLNEYEEQLKPLAPLTHVTIEKIAQGECFRQVKSGRIFRKLDTEVVTKTIITVRDIDTGDEYCIRPGREVIPVGNLPWREKEP